MAAGSLPFKGEYEQADLNAVINSEPAPLKGAPKELEQTINKALTKSPQARYQKAGEILDDLK